jgi:hypothetical protein
MNNLRSGLAESAIGVELRLRFRTPLETGRRRASARPGQSFAQDTLSENCFSHARSKAPGLLGLRSAREVENSRRRHSHTLEETAKRMAEESQADGEQSRKGKKSMKIKTKQTLWSRGHFSTPVQNRDVAKVPRSLLERLTDAVCNVSNKNIFERVGICRQVGQLHFF